jgi:N terminus of Rad21 / Rec8 like protein
MFSLWRSVHHQRALICIEFRYGVARVYSQQCGYVLADAQAVRDKVRGVSMIMNELALDPEAGRVR